MFQFRDVGGGDSEPVEASELAELARIGVVTEETPVRAWPDGGWQPAWRIAALQVAFGLALPRVLPEGNDPSARRQPTAPPLPASASPFDAPLPRRKGLSVGAGVLGGLMLAALLVWLVRVMVGGGPAATRDGRMQVILPPGWRQLPATPDTELRAETDGGDTVALVIRMDRSPDEPEMSLEAFDYGLIQGTIRGSDQFEDLGTRRYQANGLDFLRHDFRGTIHGNDGFFTLTSTRTGNSFYRMVVGAVPKRAAARKPDLEAIVLSFRRKQ